MNRVAFCLMLLLLVGMMALPAAAQIKDKDLLTLGGRSGLPLDVNAGKLTTRRTPAGVESTFINNVRVQRGDLAMQCDELILSIDEKAAKTRSASKSIVLPKSLQHLSGLRSIMASGRVKIVQKDRWATADKVLFDFKTRTLTLTGGPARFECAKEVAQAATIVLYSDEGLVEIIDGNRREMRPICPRERSGTDGPK